MTYAPPPATRVGALGLLGVLVLVVTLGLDRILSGRSLAEEGPPDFSAPYLARSLGLAVASALIAVAMRQRVRSILPRSVLPRSDGPVRSQPGGHGSPAGTGPVDTMVISAGVVISGLSVMLLYVDPSLLSTLASEDNIVEWASAVLAFAAGALCLLAAANHRRSRPGTTDGRALIVLLGFLGAGFLLLGLEEVSWFQRVLDVESPEVFLNRNGQQETNLHNMATTLTGNMYYVGAFALTVALPGLLADRALPLRWRRLEAAVPGDSVLLAAVPAAGFVYEMWNVAWIQMVLYLSLAGVVAVGSRGRSTAAVVVGLATIVTAAVFLSQGERMVRSWDDTEIRELIIPLSLVLYGIQVWRRSPRGTGPFDPVPPG